MQLQDERRVNKEMFGKCERQLTLKEQGRTIGSDRALRFGEQSLYEDARKLLTRRRSFQNRKSVSTPKNYTTIFHASVTYLVYHISA